MSLPKRPDVGIMDYLQTVLFCLLFFLLLIIWDVVQRVSYYIFGERALHRIDRTLNWLILALLRVTTGSSYRIVNPFVFSNEESYIVVSNHQSMFDISLIHELVWHLNPRFISKRELGKWIPGISFNLRAGGHPLIDRSSPSHALLEIIRVGKRMSRENFATVIFPEGTRARDGVLKRFKSSGLLALLRKAPKAKVVVVAVDGSWLFQTFNLWPIPGKSPVHLEVIEVLDQEEFESPEAVIKRCEKLIGERLCELREKDKGAVSLAEFKETAPPA
jgi:1-acyl-sn-glycerol-3-phosphate acyltransferase